MPSTRITVKTGLTSSDKQALIEETHSALISALKIPAWDKLYVIDEKSEDDFACPPNASERYTLVEITLFPGRSIDAKRDLYTRIVEGYGDLGIPKEDIRIILYEVPLENWGIRSGVPASDVDLGFTLDV